VTDRGTITVLSRLCRHDVRPAASPGRTRRLTGYLDLGDDHDDRADRPLGPERLSLQSRDLTADRIALLRQLFPEVFREDEIDFDARRCSLGDRTVEPGRERFGLSWPGKADCMRIIQQASLGTLIPDRNESVAFDTTRNVVFEGDNLEVLKLLQNNS